MSSRIHPRLHNLYQYWKTIKNTRHMPTKADLDLHRIPTHLPCAFLIKWDPLTAAFFWRLTGTALYTLFGRELTATPVLDLWQTDQHEELTSTLHRVRTVFQPFCLRQRGFNITSNELGIEMLILPLLDTDSTNVLIFGGFEPFSTPLWLDSHPLKMLVNWQTVALNDRSRDQQPMPAIPLASVAPSTKVDQKIMR